MLIVEFLAILYIPEMEEDENFAVLEDQKVTFSALNDQQINRLKCWLTINN